jgi:hypothetical protein
LPTLLATAAFFWEEIQMKIYSLIGSLLLATAAWAQANLDVRKMPELGAHVVFDAIPRAVSYNWYEASAVGDCTKSSFTFDHNQLLPVYDDSPMPGFYDINVQDRGKWQHNWWCYEIEPVFANGTVGARSLPYMVRIGSSGYVTLHYKSGSCTGPTLPNPYSFAQLWWKVYYRDAAGANHEMNVIQNVASATAMELEWKLPDVAKDGTIVPLLENGHYYYELVTPDGFRTAGAITPQYMSDAAEYAQVNLYKVLNGPQCFVGFGTGGGDYTWTQNVIR